MGADCIFCKIVAGQIPSQKVYEDDLVFAFNDISPLTPVHVLIIPKKHIETLNDLPEDDPILSRLMTVAAKVAKMNNIDKPGYRVVFNVNPDGGQVIFHVHLHVLGGAKLRNPA